MTKRGNDQYTAGEECDTTRFVTYSIQTQDPREGGHTNGNYASSACPSPLVNMGINGQVPNDHIKNLQNEIRNLRKAVHTLEERFDNENDVKYNRSVYAHEWRYVGLVLDRFFFVLYLFLLVASMAALFPRHKL